MDPFRPILGHRAHEEVVDQITFAVRAGIYTEGDRLPSIGELAQAMRVSKPVVGEAIRILSESGVISAQRGSSGGLTVSSDDIPVTLLRMSGGAQHAALAELVEARRPVETQIALLAGERATDHDLRDLGSAITKYKRYRHSSGSLRTHFDHLFHYGLGRAARSGLLARYQHQILEQLAIVLEGYYRDEEDPELVIATHEETLAAVAARDPAQILAAMDRHLGNLESVAARGLPG